MKLIKRLIFLIIALGVVGAIAVVVLVSQADTLVKAGIEKTMSFVLEVDVTVEEVKIRPLQGSVGIAGLVIGNPEGFHTQSAISLDEVSVEADLMSFRTDEPLIRLISIQRPKVTLEQGLRSSNLSTLIASASRFGADGEPPAEEEEEEEAEPTPEGAEMKLKLEKIVVADTTVAVSAPILKGAEASYTLSTIELDDVGGKDAYVTVAELLRIILTEILMKSVEAAQGVIPDDLQSSLSRGATELGTSLSETLVGDQELGEAVSEGLSGAVGGIKNLLGGDKE